MLRLKVLRVLFGGALVLPFSAQAGLLIEPYVGFEGGSFSHHITDYKTPLVGLRTGLKFAKVLAVGIDASHRFTPVSLINPKDLIKDAVEEATRDAINRRTPTIPGQPDRGQSERKQQAGPTQATKKTQPSQSGTQKSQTTDLALFVMLDPGLWFRVYAVYAQMFRSRDFDARGRSMRAGLSFTGLPFVAINAEISRRKTEGATKSGTTYGLSLSVPLP